MTADPPQHWRKVFEALDDRRKYGTGDGSNLTVADLVLCRAMAFAAAEELRTNPKAAAKFQKIRRERGARPCRDLEKQYRNLVAKLDQMIAEWRS